METAGAEIHWLWNVLDAGVLPGAYTSKYPDRASPSDLLADLTRNRRLPYWSLPKLYAFLDDFGVVRKPGRRRYLQFPPLAEMRAAFQALWPWYTEKFADGQDHWQFFESPDDDGR